MGPVRASKDLSAVLGSRLLSLAMLEDHCALSDVIYFHAFDRFWQIRYMAFNTGCIVTSMYFPAEFSCADETLPVVKIAPRQESIESGAITGQDTKETYAAFKQLAVTQPASRQVS